MQTFLPYSSFLKSAKILDYRRLGKQRIEAKQILECIKFINNKDFYNENGKLRGWLNHPAVKMWLGYEGALKQYTNTIIREWINRGYSNNMEYFDLECKIVYPCWLGNIGFHAAHRSNLLRKDYEFYSQYGWRESNNLPYIWPDKNE